MSRSIKSKMRVEGLKELEAALQELPRATGGNVLKRAIIKPAQLFADRAIDLAPKKSGKLKRSIRVSKPRVISAGKAAFAAAMREGATRAEAGEAARAANAASGGAGRHAVVSVGPTRSAFHGLFQEFGTAHFGPKSFMRPAWDALSSSFPKMIADTLWEEIEKARQRIAKRAARLASKSK